VGFLGRFVSLQGLAGQGEGEEEKRKRKKGEEKRKRGGKDHN